MCLPAALPALASVFGTGAAAAGATTAAGLTTAQMVSLGLSAASTGLSVLGAYNQASTGKAVAKYNAAVADAQSKDALALGEKEAMAVRRGARQLRGRQGAAFSARGIDISEGSAADVMDQTDFFGESDAATARNNARKAAWGYQARKRGFDIEADTYSPLAMAGSALLTGGSQVADKWYRFKG